MGQQYNNPQKNPQTNPQTNPGQKMPGQQDDKHREVRGNPQEPNKTGKDNGVRTPARERDE